ncbi:hypothetical protein HYV71_03630 [Candidatus Uhrbacteria bacterium]|nr:hypothetical protein [Candidatus Uhrbacteria bacterium]
MRNKRTKTIFVLALLSAHIVVFVFPLRNQALFAFMFCGSNKSAAGSYTGCYNDLDHLKYWGNPLEPTANQYRARSTTTASPWQAQSKSDQGGRVCRKGVCVPLYEPKILSISTPSFAQAKIGRNVYVSAIVDVVTQGPLKDFRWGTYLVNGKRVPSWTARIPDGPLFDLPYWELLFRPNKAYTLSFDSAPCGFEGAGDVVKENGFVVDNRVPRIVFDKIIKSLPEEKKRYLPFRYHLKINKVQQKGWNLCVLEVYDPWGVRNYKHFFLEPKKPEPPKVDIWMEGQETKKEKEEIRVGPDSTVKVRWQTQNAERIEFRFGSPEMRLKWFPYEDECSIGAGFVMEKTAYCSEFSKDRERNREQRLREFLKAAQEWEDETMKNAQEKFGVRYDDPLVRRGLWFQRSALLQQFPPQVIDDIEKRFVDRGSIEINSGMSGREVSIYAYNNVSSKDPKDIQEASNRIEIKVVPLRNIVLISKVVGPSDLQIQASGEGIYESTMLCATSWPRSGCDFTAESTKKYWHGKDSISWTISDVDMGDTLVDFWFKGVDEAGHVKEEYRRATIKGGDLVQCVVSGFDEHFSKLTIGYNESLYAVGDYTPTDVSKGVDEAKKLVGNSSTSQNLGMCLYRLNGQGLESVSCFIKEIMTAIEKGAKKCKGDTANAIAFGVSIGGIFSEPIPGIRISLAGLIVGSLSKKTDEPDFFWTWIFTAGIVIVSGIMYKILKLDFLINEFKKMIIDALQILSVSFDIEKKLKKGVINTIIEQANGIPATGGPNPKTILPELIPNYSLVRCTEKGTCDQGLMDFQKKGMGDVSNLVTSAGKLSVGLGWPCDTFEKCSSNALQIACAIKGKTITRDNALAKIKSSSVGSIGNVKTPAWKIIHFSALVVKDTRYMTESQAGTIVSEAGGCP